MENSKKYVIANQRMRERLAELDNQVLPKLRAELDAQRYCPMCGSGTVPSRDDTELLRRVKKLCEWIGETPHTRGSINGLAAQLEHVLRERLK